jgi:predicted NUDIX family NTP pyrophosphohydrolase
MNLKTLFMSAGTAVLSVGFSLQPHATPFWETNIVIAGEESIPKGNVQSDEDSSADQSATMGKDEGTQTGGTNQSTPPENDTQKIDQPPRQNRTTGQ